MKNIAIIGASGAIGRAFVAELSSDPDNIIHAFSRDGSFAQNINHHHIEITDEVSAEQASQQATTWDMVIVTTGVLHSDNFMPEKSLKNITAKQMQEVFNINTIGPALVAKYFIPMLSKGQRAIFAALSARVGSISDNHLGGWYSYRASKSALNMIIKSAAIETARRNPDAIIIGLHPGTTESRLSAPFSGNVPKGKLFSPEFSASQMLTVIDKLTAQDSGQLFAWDGTVIGP